MYRVIKTTFEPSLLWETLAKDHIISRDELCFGRGDFLLGWLQLYEMGKYFALALHLYGKEDHIEATDRELGLDIYKPEIASLVRKMLDTLCNQLAISNYWKISESTLELLGELYKDMEFFYKNDYGEERLESMCENDFDKLPFHDVFVRQKSRLFERR